MIRPVSVARRHFLQFAGAAAMFAAAPKSTVAKPLRGIFPIVQTPFTESDKLDLDTLAGHIRFLDRARAHGCAWPQNASEWPTLSEAERRAGVEVICSTCVSLRPAIVIGV